MMGRRQKYVSPWWWGRSRRKCAGGKGSSYSIGGSKKGKSPRQIVEMHDSPSQVVVKLTTLSMIHEEAHGEERIESDG